MCVARLDVAWEGLLRLLQFAVKVAKKIDLDEKIIVFFNFSHN